VVSLLVRCRILEVSSVLWSLLVHDNNKNPLVIVPLLCSFDTWFFCSMWGFLVLSPTFNRSVSTSFPFGLPVAKPNPPNPPKPPNPPPHTPNPKPLQPPTPQTPQFVLPTIGFTPPSPLRCQFVRSGTLPFFTHDSLPFFGSTLSELLCTLFSF